MHKLQQLGQNLGQVFNFRSGHLKSAHLWCYRVKLPNLKLKTRTKQLLVSPLLDIVLTNSTLEVSVCLPHMFSVLCRKSTCLKIWLRRLLGLLLLFISLPRRQPILGYLFQCLNHILSIVVLG